MELSFKQKVIKEFTASKWATFESIRADQQNKLNLAGQDNIESKQIESKNDAAVRELDFLNKNIDILSKEIELLEQMPANDESDEVTFGALVQTDKATFLVGVAQETMDIDGKKVAGISMASPIYKKMEGKGKGAEAEVNDTEHKIVDLI